MNSNNLKDLYEGYSAVYDDNLRESLKFETWVNELLDEGYDLSDYTLDELYDVYEEREDGVKPYEPRKRNPLPKEKPLSGKKGDGSGYGGDEKFTKPDDKIEKPGTTVPAPKKGGYGRIMSNIPYGIGDHRDKTQSNVSRIRGRDTGAPRSQKLPPKENLNNSYDLYDIILTHLLDEGYADTNENALVIMANMSEDWREDIVEGFKELPISRMNKQARRIAFSHGTEVTSDEGSHGIVRHKDAAKALRKMARIGGKEVKAHIRKGYAQGSKYDPYYQELNSRNPSRNLNNSYDLYDIILTHLLDEGYADTQEAAESIMVNMSEDWREDIVEGFKELPISRMNKQARRIAFSHGTEVNSDEGSQGSVRHKDAAKALAKMARIGGKEVKAHIRKGYAQGSKYDPYYQELNSRNPSRNKEV